MLQPEHFGMIVGRIRHKDQFEGTREEKYSLLKMGKYGFPKEDILLSLTLDPIEKNKLGKKFPEFANGVPRSGFFRSAAGKAYGREMAKIFSRKIITALLEPIKK